MKKQIKSVALAGAALLALTGAANAATIDVNLYGASAQFLFWNAAAPGFLTSVRHCTATTQTTSADAKHEITQGTGCDGGTNTINIRYSSKASFDGIYAVKNQDPSNTCPGKPGQRPIITGAGNAALLCQDIHVGASDVGGVSFTQQSHGQLFGPLGGGDVGSSREFNAISTAGLTSYQPVVVPFGFFANKSVKVYTCDGTTSPGNLCTTATSADDCGAINLCTQKTIDNITREMAVQIFSGNAVAWTDFGPSYSVTGDPTNSVVACSAMPAPAPTPPSTMRS